MKKNNLPQVNSEGTVDYSAKKTEGTKWAEEHLNRTRKNPDGSMLTPPSRQIRKNLEGMRVLQQMYHCFSVHATKV